MIFGVNEMIINYPTGLYKSALVNSNNVTWLISSTEPPRSIERFTKVPIAEEYRTLKPLDDNRKRDVGDLIFTINEADEKIVGSSRQQYYEGELLEFSDDAITKLDDISNNRIESRHNTNVVDGESIGLTEAEVNEIINGSNKKYKELSIEFIDTKQEITTIEITISELQKSLNDVRRAIGAVEVIDDQTILIKLEERETKLVSDIGRLVTEHHEKSQQLNVIVSQLQNIKEMVK